MVLTEHYFSKYVYILVVPMNNYVTFKHRHVQFFSVDAPTKFYDLLFHDSCIGSLIALDCRNLQICHKHQLVYKTYVYCI